MYFFMKTRILFILVVLCILLGPGTHANAENSNPNRSSFNLREWKIGYWYWSSYQPKHIGQPDEATPDLLYVWIGDIPEYKNDWSTASRDLFQWPSKLPDAAVYYAVIRCKESLPPKVEMIPSLIMSYMRIKEEAQKRKHPVIGLQLDYDCPTSRLDQYADFLKALKNAMPSETKLSITALLDWFRDGKRFDQVARHVDEFVPQFYDVDPRLTNRDFGTDRTGIVQSLDPSKWAPIFNSFNKPYRVGIAVFGRIEGIEIKEFFSTVSPETKIERTVRSSSPLEAIARKDFVLWADITSDAGEKILRFRNPEESDNKCDGSHRTELMEMILPTPRSVRSVYQAAQALEGMCSGVVFFRWPNKNEAMVLTPLEIQAILGRKGATPSAPQVEGEDGYCATVCCTNLFVRLKDRFPVKAVSLNIRSSQPIEYIIPSEHIPARMLDAHHIQLMIPAYAGVPKIYIGRAVTNIASRFSIEEQP